MKIFITGGSGFLGKHLISFLSQNGHEIAAPTRSECDLTKYDDLRKYSIEYDVIYHLAAYTQAGDWCLTHSGEQWLMNQQINTNVLKWWFEHNRNAKLISMGTSCSYSPENDLVEENYSIGEPIESLHTYAMTKRMLYYGCKSLEKQYSMEYLHVVPSTLYGSGYHQDGRQMHFIFDLIRKILRGRDLGEEVELWGDGFQKREIVHVKDFLNNLQCLVSNGATGTFNLGTGTEHSIRSFAEIISEVCGFDFKKIKFNESKYVGARSKVLDVNKARAFIGNYSERSLIEGISEVVEWFENSKSHLSH